MEGAFRGTKEDESYGYRETLRLRQVNPTRIVVFLTATKAIDGDTLVLHVMYM